MTTVFTFENPVKIISKRDEIEFKNVLETLKLLEIENNPFKNKYQIYFMYSFGNKIYNKIIKGYIIDFKSYESSNNLKNIEFLFIDTNYKFYIFQSLINALCLENTEYFYYGDTNLNLNLNILESEYMTDENRNNFYFKDIIINGVNNVSCIFDFESFTEEKTLRNLSLLSLLQHFSNNQNKEIKQGEYLLYKYSKYIMNEISFFNV
jgi:hypothetical protein